MDKKVLEILKYVLGPDIDETASQKTLDVWDSLNHVRIVLELEAEFGVRIASDEVDSIRSYQAILKFLEDKDVR